MIKNLKTPESKDVTEKVDKTRAHLAQKGLDEKLTEEERNAFYDHSSERAMAIVLGTIVENRLTELIQLLMRREKTLVDELFNPSGPLGPFGTKIRLAYMLRIISAETYKDLIVINKIRNKFAHDLSVTTFENQQISAWIQNMHLYGIVKRMGEEAAERLKNNSSEGYRDRTADFIKSNALLSFKDSYRDCLRYMIHHLSDHVNAIKVTETELNAT